MPLSRMSCAVCWEQWVAGQACVGLLGCVSPARQAGWPRQESTEPPGWNSVLCGNASWHIVGVNGELCCVTLGAGALRADQLCSAPLGFSGTEFATSRRAGLMFLVCSVLVKSCRTALWLLCSSPRAGSLVRSLGALNPEPCLPGTHSEVPVPQGLRVDVAVTCH